MPEDDRQQLADCRRQERPKQGKALLGIPEITATRKHPQLGGPLEFAVLALLRRHVTQRGLGFRYVITAQLGFDPEGLLGVLQVITLQRRGLTLGLAAVAFTRPAFLRLVSESRVVAGLGFAHVVVLPVNGLLVAGLGIAQVLHEALAGIVGLAC